MHSPENSFNPQPLILLVEREIEILENLAATITEAGYLTRSCSTAEEAFAAAKESRPDLIICDVVVEEQGGEAVCERIRREAERNEIPVMFLSPNQIPDIIRRRGPLGGSYYLRKPFDASLLLDLLEKTLNSTFAPALSEI